MESESRPQIRDGICLKIFVRDLELNLPFSHELSAVEQIYIPREDI